MAQGGLGTTTGAMAHAGWTGGVGLHDVAPALVVAAGIAALLGWLVVAHRRGRTRLLSMMADLSEDISGTPGWTALPAFVGGIALVVACFGFYWDVATHMDRGRDIGPFANPSHYPILAGLVGLVVAAVFAVALGGEDEPPTGARVARGWRAPLGGLLLGVCAVAAVLGFPLDDMWHRIFGEDVTLWSPTHILMVAGASLTTLALWVLYAEIQHSPRLRRGDATQRLLFVRLPEIAIAGAFLIGLSTLQAEFDYGFPQFRLVLQPVLIMLAAGIGLVAARIRLGRGGAVLAVLFFLGFRGYLAVAIDFGLEHLTLHMPLYLVEALLVEGVALVVPRERQVSLGAWSGLAIGTIGFAGEWVWSQVWMPIPWNASLLPEAFLLGLPAAIAGGVLGGLIGRALTPPGIARQQVRTGAVAAVAGVVAVTMIALPLPRDGIGGVTGEVALEEVRPAPTRLVHVTVDVEPTDAPEGATWFMVTAWQGATPDDPTSVMTHLEQVDAGRWRTTEPVPVYGEWKTMIRLHRGAGMASLPVRIPPDPLLDLPGIPVQDRMVRPFVPDTVLLQAVARDVPGWVSPLAYGVMGLIAAAWIGAFVWGLEQLRRRTDHLAAPGPGTSAPPGAGPEPSGLAEPAPVGAGARGEDPGG